MSFKEIEFYEKQLENPNVNAMVKAHFDAHPPVKVQGKETGSHHLMTFFREDLLAHRGLSSGEGKKNKMTPVDFTNALTLLYFFQKEYQSSFAHGLLYFRNPEDVDALSQISVQHLIPLNMNRKYLSGGMAFENVKTEEDKQRYRIMKNGTSKVTPIIEIRGKRVPDWSTIQAKTKLFEGKSPVTFYHPNVIAEQAKSVTLAIIQEYADQFAALRVKPE